ncbi:MAG: hypothetical protein DRO67_04935 [Candidatus Asgardarchaeum californiense]|nr:MAG: hypothetical protein DRO67_04935 [Candidatus Asgardarchaeum californiense]
MVGAFLEILLIIFLVNLAFYYLQTDVVAATIAQLGVDPEWKATAMALFQHTYSVENLGIYGILWFLSGALFGIRHKSIKENIALGLITSLLEAHFYLLMIQQYTPDVWNSYSAAMQQSITISIYIDGLITGVVLALGMLSTSVITIYRERKKRKVVIKIPEEELKPIVFTCPHCGHVHYSYSKYCASCGQPIEIAPPEIQEATTEMPEAK